MQKQDCGWFHFLSPIINLLIMAAKVAFFMQKTKKSLYFLAVSPKKLTFAAENEHDITINTVCVE
jgi:hypothetical protein